MSRLARPYRALSLVVTTGHALRGRGSRACGSLPVAWATGPGPATACHMAAPAPSRRTAKADGQNMQA